VSPYEYSELVFDLFYTIETFTKVTVTVPYKHKE